MLANRLRSWTSIDPALGECLVFAGQTSWKYYACVSLPPEALFRRAVRARIRYFISLSGRFFFHVDCWKLFYSGRALTWLLQKHEKEKNHRRLLQPTVPVINDYGVIRCNVEIYSRSTSNFFIRNKMYEIWSNVYLKHTTTLLSLSDYYILSREWRVIVDLVQTNYCDRPFVLKSVRCDRAVDYEGSSLWSGVF